VACDVPATSPLINELKTRLRDDHKVIVKETYHVRKSLNSTVSSGNDESIVSFAGCDEIIGNGSLDCGNCGLFIFLSYLFMYLLFCFSRYRRWKLYRRARRRQLILF